MSEEDDIDLASLSDDELVEQMHDDLYDGLQEEIQDAVNYAFAALVALSVAVSFDADKHVRVDVFRQNWSERTNRRIDWLGDLLLALPVFAIMLWTAFPLVKSSWAILEGSPETGGLPGLFLVKTCLVILPALVVIYILQKLFCAMRRKFS